MLMNIFRRRLSSVIVSHKLWCRSLWNVIFFGTDKFSKRTLETLVENRCSASLDKVVGHIDVVCVEGNCAVEAYATKNGVTVHRWPFIVPPNQYDIGVVVSFGQLIHSESIRNCRYGMINGHPSILPRWRGAAPVHHAILHGDTETGGTILQVSPNKFDVGNILMQEKCLIPVDCTTEQLQDILSRRVAEMILRTLKDLPCFLKNSYPQPSEGVTYATKIKPEMGLIDWTQTKEKIDRQFRALLGSVKLYTYWKVMKILLLDHLKPEEASAAQVDTLVKRVVKPGALYYHRRKKILFVKCQDGWVGISTVSIPVRGKITALDFYNGFMTKVERDEWFFVSRENKSFS